MLNVHNGSYTLLSRVMLSILTLPCSNADFERMFSHIKCNDTDFRASMGQELLQSLTITKSAQIASDQPCYNSISLNLVKTS